MRATLGDESAKVWQEASGESISLTTIYKGEEFEIGKVIRKKKETWVTVTLDNGVTGFISGDTHIFAIQTVEAIGNDLEVYETASDESPVLTVIPKKTVFIVRGVEKVEEDTWYRVENSEGVKGYVKAGPRLRCAHRSPARARANDDHRRDLCGSGIDTLLPLPGAGGRGR